MNRYELIGNLTKTPAIRYTPQGTPVLDFTVAINETKTDREGKEQKTVSFIPLSIFGKSAETHAKRLQKGTRVFVTAKVNSWSKPEEKKSGFNFDVQSIEYLASSQQQPHQENTTASNDQQAGQSDSDGTVDDWMKDYDSNNQAQ
jgi:single-strand DNA-binding protein